MNRALALACALAASAASARASAQCGACRSGALGSDALTASDERWAVVLTATTRRELASWDATGRVHAAPLSSTVYDATGTVAFGVRVLRPLELSVATGGGAAWLREPGVALDTGGLTDTTARARLDVLREDPLREGAVPLATAAWFTARAPTGNASLAGGGAAGVVGALGLGAWEFALGLDARRTFGHGRVQPFASFEGALRAPDRSTTEAVRALGPRVTARAGVAWFVRDQLALALLAEWNWEDDVALAGQPLPDSWEHRASLALSLASRDAGGLRTSVALAGDLPVDGLGRNAEASVRAVLSVGYGAPERAWQRACPMDPAHPMPASAGAVFARHDAAPDGARL